MSLKKLLFPTPKKAAGKGPGKKVNRNRAFRDTDIHFLHIGKCAGTQIRNISEQLLALKAERRIVKHSHDVFLKDLPRQAEYFFSIREPISRFRSGFYSRKRKGAPRLHREWTQYERPAFADFEHANDLAESLFAEGERGLKAWAAMKSIRHTAQNQADWFFWYGTFLDVRPPVWIIRQERFDEDLEVFLRRAKLESHGASLELARDSLEAHANDYSGLPPLSERAKDNLRRWYAQDIEFYRMCDTWLDAAMAKGA